MSFGAPEWILLLPALIVLGWRIRGLRLHESLRVVALALLVLVLIDPKLQMGGGGLDLWVMMDRSDSVGAAAMTQEPEISAILRNRKGTDDRIFWVDYASDAVRRDQGDPVFRGTQQTRTGNALDFTLAQLDRKRPSRLLLLTDGYATEPLGAAGEKLLRSGVPLDYRLMGTDPGADFRISNLVAPTRVLPGESFLVEFDILGPNEGSVPWEVWRGGQKAAEGSAIVRHGVGHVRLSDRLNGSGAARYQVRLNPAKDAHADNKTAATWVEVAGGPRALLLTNFPDDPLAGLLRTHGLEVGIVTDAANLTAASLTGMRVVVFNNVPAHRVAPKFLAALDFFVREQGGGLLMAGGENSFGSGGYFSSELDPLLPVSMEIRRENRKLAVAMSIVLDRSGSMAASAAGGLTKMDLADAGAARSIELLGDSDAVSVYAVDTTPHVVVGLAEVQGNRRRMIQSVRSIVSEGGGIYTYTGIKAGWQELQKAQTGQRHMILFADAADAEEPGDYIHLLEEIRAQGGTVSVIGMGTEADKDADFLKDVAARGGGRIFFNANPAELPAVFAQETVSVARSVFVKEPTPVQGTPGWAQFAARAPHWLTQVDGYNLSYLRPDATAAVITTDEYHAPLVAGWTRGSGHVAAVTFPLAGQYSKMARDWADYGDFVQTLTRWLAGDDAPPGAALHVEVEGTQLTLELRHDETWTARMAVKAPTLTLAESSGGHSAETVRDLLWEKIEPGLFRAVAELEPGRAARGVVHGGGVTLPFGPVETASAEWSFDRARLTELKLLSAQSGGRERLDLASIWDAPRTRHERPLRGWLLAVLTVVILIEAAVTRLGLNRASPSVRR